MLVCLDVHGESIAAGFELQNAATVSSTAIKCDGNNSVQTLFKISPDWTGNINAVSVEQSEVTNPIIDPRRPYPLANQVPHDDQLVWPPSQGSSAIRLYEYFAFVNFLQTHLKF